MKFPFFNNKSKKNEVYLGLFLKEEEGIAMIIMKDQGKLTIKDRESFKYTNGWENLTEDVDEVLFRLEKSNNVQVEETIFFVYSHLIDERSSDIRKPFLIKIKELVKNLELKVLGYIECFEAVSYYLEKTEEIPLNAVLLEMDRHQFSVFVIKGGRVNFRKSIARTNNIAEDLQSALLEVKGKAMLPSRIILYDSGNIDDEATKIISYRWGEDYFAQIPKIDIFHEEKILEGLTDVFSGQIGNKSKDTVEEIKSFQGSEFGFVIGRDIAEVKEALPIKEQPVFGQKSKFNFKFSLPKIDLSFLKVLKGRLGVIIGLSIIIVSLFLNEYFFHKAQMTIYLPSQTIEKSITEKIEFKTATATADFSESITTTGKRSIGDKAKGSVNIHNFSSNERIFTKGTNLTANNLEFLLDAEVKVASSSIAADGSAKLPGKSQGSITAVEIGPESNLSKGQRFKIGDLSSDDFFAISDTVLSGGSRKEIRTVAKVDQDKLTEKILDKAGKQMRPPSLKNNEEIVDSLSSIELDEEKFSKEVGEEGDSVSLTTKSRMTFFVYDKVNLDKKIIAELKKDLKSGFKIAEKSLSYKIKEAKTDNKLLTVDLDIDTKAIKDLDKEKLMSKIIARTTSKLESILKTEADIQAYDVVISQPLPFLKNLMPVFKNNITVKVSSL